MLRRRGEFGTGEVEGEPVQEQEGARIGFALENQCHDENVEIVFHVKSLPMQQRGQRGGARTSPVGFFWRSGDTESKDDKSSTQKMVKQG